ncbi:unnamed protein product [Nesidiocoris tenuis]|uniref:Uncharacterized protein n=1 Tax=Nesidiocoris tenuis TaxID=355587 RepID=A0A6H5G4J6_9HEMI|nr:unnamed protein product [Nesidiocoris tenuis]
MTSTMAAQCEEYRAILVFNSIIRSATIPHRAAWLEGREADASDFTHPEHHTSYELCRYIGPDKSYFKTYIHIFELDRIEIILMYYTNLLNSFPIQDRFPATTGEDEEADEKQN